MSVIPLLVAISQLGVSQPASLGPLQQLGFPTAQNGPELADLDPLLELIAGQDCNPRLLQRRSHRFVEPSIACAAFASFALVSRIVERDDGKASVEESTRLRALLYKALSDRSRAMQAAGPVGQRTALQLGGSPLPRDVLYRGYLLLIFAGVERVGAADPQISALFDELATGLRDDYASSPLLPSRKGSTWPCDNALAASGLALHGRLRDHAGSKETGARVAEFLEQLTHSPHGFPVRTKPDGTVLYPTPRASTLAWTAAFLTIGGHPQAARFGELLVGQFCQRRAYDGQMMAACREWPRGVRKSGDAVSGPIYYGYGVAASTLAIAATRGAGQDDWHRQLLNLGYRVGLRSIAGSPKRYPLENVVLHWARSLRAW